MKKRPLSESAVACLAAVARVPLPRQDFNPGVVDKLIREGLAGMGVRPTPFATRTGMIQFLEITEEGRLALAHAKGIKTPVSHPDHHVVGHWFRGWDGEFYYCDSYDPRQGYWLTRHDATPFSTNDESASSPLRKNVSERAIGATFHELPELFW